MHVLALDPVDEVGAAREIAPLVAAAGLQHAAVLAVELEEVEALQDLVAELGVADAGVGVQPRGDRVLLQHRADAVVLADIAQEVDRTEPGRPVEVVHEAHGVLALAREEARHLCGAGSPTHSTTVSFVLSVRSAVGRGSPMSPVEPPTSASG